ncbi:MAG: hypothetical protein Q8Q01_03145 [archaeon]|nr:hypothetical protein [archaeon]
MNRRGTVTEEVIIFVIFGFIALGLVIALFTTIVQYDSRATEWPLETQSELIALRFVNNPDCFAASDEINGRVITNSIDLSKFNGDQFKQCYPETELRSIQFKLSLEGEQKDIITPEFHDIISATLFKEVLVWKNGRFQKDRLLIYVQKISDGGIF